MTLLLLAWLVAADAHDGEDHGAPAPVEAHAQQSRLPTWSSEFDAVVRFPAHAEPGEPMDALLLLADASTSAPIATGTAKLTFDSDTHVEAEARSSSAPGEWPFSVTLPSAGPWTGGITVLADRRSDVLGLPEWRLPDHDAHAAAVGLSWAAGAGLAAIGAGLLGLGWALGRRRGLVAVSGLVALGVAVRGQAHNGEDHGAPAAPTAVAADGSVRLQMESQFLLGLRTERVYTVPFQQSVHANGLVVPAPDGRAELRAPFAGVVGSVGDAAIPGAWVRAGEPLLTLSQVLGQAESAGVRSGEAAARAHLASVQRDLTLAQRDVAQLEGLASALSERDKLARQRELDVTTEAVAQARREVDAFASGGSRLVLRSPIAGRLSALIARPGDAVDAGQPIARVLGTRALWVEADVPEARAAGLRAGDSATVTDVAHQTWTATVLDAGLEVDRATGQVRITLALDDAAATLRAGAAVTVDLHTGAPHDALTVADTAVVDSAGVPFVFVKLTPESFALREVALGASDGARREVLRGVAAGDRVVAQGTYALRALAGR